MNGPSRVFLPALREVEKQLSIPLPQRVQVLRELEFDLEELRRRFQAEGLSSELARDRALAALVPNREAIHELGRVHTPRYRRLTRPIEGDRLRALERAALAVVTLSLLAVGSLALARSGLLQGPSPFLWPVMALGGLSCAIAMNAAFELWVRADHVAVRRWPPAILVTAGATVAVGVFGALADSLLLLAATDVEATLVQPQVRDWLLRESTVLSVAMALALAGGLAWFVLTQRLAVVHAAYREAMGLEAVRNT